jgi:hypothetical protein
VSVEEHFLKVSLLAFVLKLGLLKVIYKPPKFTQVQNELFCKLLGIFEE